MITWEDFIFTNRNNTRTAFENMCRILFNYYFFSNKAIFEQKPNNPGIEIEPICHNGKMISFQAKFIESDSIYAQIKDSLKTAVAHYGNILDTIYIFSNKDLDETSKAYKEILGIIEPYNIILKRICGQELLSIIESNNYHTIKQLFFGNHNLSNEWFENNLKTALEDLEPRYVSGFNINTEIQHYFELKYMTEEVFTELSSFLSDRKKTLDNIRTNLPEINNVKAKIKQLTIPDKTNFKSIFEWIDQFSDDKQQLENRVKQLDKKIYSTTNEQTIQRLYKEINDIEAVLRVIEQLDMSNNLLFNSYNSNVLFIEGEGGIGKSHLLGYEAEKHGNNYNRTILILGHKLIGTTAPTEQIKDQLNTKLNIDELLYILEGMGEIDDSNTIIMIDALNESAHHQIWINYLNDFVNKILKCKHIKLIATIRSSYTDLIFSDAIKSKIKGKQITKILHTGFEGNLEEAIEKFFTYYNIPVTSNAYLGYSFANPLFLKIYCEVCSNTQDFIGSKSLGEIFDKYIIEEEKKIKFKLNISGSYPFCRKILENFAQYVYENKTTYIDIEKLYEINEKVPKHSDIIPLLLKSQLLISYYKDSKEIIFFAYERMYDIIIAKMIINKFDSYVNLANFIKKDLIAVDKYGNFVHPKAVGIFSALSIEVSEKYDDEILEIIDRSSLAIYNKKRLFEDCLRNLIFRNDIKLNKDRFFAVIWRNLGSLSLKDQFLNSLILLAGRERNPLNADFLHQFLKTQKLNYRDHFWTIFINEQYDNAYSLRHTINYFLKKNFIVSNTEKRLYSILLAWVLTSSNRFIRDTASRSLINLLKDDYLLMQNIIEMFDEVNDPYVIQRLYGIVYGAILKSQPDSHSLSNLCETIYHKVFNKQSVYVDILLRDYALNIIEYAKYLNCKLNFDIMVCRPPYSSDDITCFEKDIEKFFIYDSEKITGANLIQFSIMPNFDGGYGDFGRYVFESAISHFAHVDMKNAYLVALDFIKNELGYKNELFSEYDKSVHGSMYDRHTTAKIERIGKKYEWIAFYNILARIADNYGVSSRYSDNDSGKYMGTWNPYVRDFDPTLDLINNDRVYNINLKLPQPTYNNWSTDKNWANKPDDVLDFIKFIFLTDNEENEWVLLHGHIKFQSNEDYRTDHKEVWRMVSSYIIDEKEYDDFISTLKDKPLWGRWFPESSERCNIFNREFCWSPAYKDEYANEIFDVNISTGKIVKKTTTIPIPEILDNGSQDAYSDSMRVFNEAFTYTSNEKVCIGRVKPLWNSYLWEEQYDASKEESVGIDLPTREIIEYFGLEQKNSGMFYDKEKLVVADFSLIVGNTVGLYIRKSYLDKFLKDNHYKIFWVGMGEKNDIKMRNEFSVAKCSIFKDFSSLVYYDSNKISSYTHFGNRNGQ